MYRNNDYINQEEYPTTKVYRLRKEGRTVEAYNLAYNLYQNDSTDDDIKKALAWTLIDLCKKNISENNLTQIQAFFTLLSNLEFDYEDEFVETIKKQIRILRPKIDPNYSKVQQADELSKNGQEQQALDLILTMIANNQLSELNHETYGWIIYRYIKVQENNLSSVEVRTFLRDYMNLKNERPSMLHSMILNFALNYTKTHSDFNFYTFFVLWNPINLRYEDLRDGNKDGKSIPSLISRICKEFANSNYVVDLEKDIIQKVNLDRETVLDLFREPYFWNLFNVHKENRFADLWRLFDKYNETYGKYGKSKWHSEILKIADRFMKENDAWRFLSFFSNWNPTNFMDVDWKEEKGKDGETYKPLAIKAIKKSFEIIKNQQDNNNSDLSWLIEIYDKAVKLLPNDEWLIREKALLHIRQKDFDAAVNIYRKLVLELGDKYYIWQEFSECFNADDNLKIGMLCKALSLEKNEDFLGDIHLELAQCLINENLLANATIELQAYKRHREDKGWKINPLFENMRVKCNTSDIKLENNKDLYQKHIPLAEDYAYKDINWIEVVLVDKWKNEEKKERLTFTDGNSIEFSIGINRFSELKKAKVGQVWQFKLQKQEVKKEVEAKYIWQQKATLTEYKYLSLLVNKSDREDWTILPAKYGYVEYVNKEKNTLHIITNESDVSFYKYDKESFNKGDFVAFRQYSRTVKDEKRNFLVRVEKCEKQFAIKNFKNKIAVVDDINESKKLFHYVLGKKLLTGIAFFDDTSVRPVVGEFLKIYYCVKKEKDDKKKLVTLFVEKTDEQNSEIKKTISGRLELKYKNDWNGEADFAFIGDYYVSKSILQKYNIVDGCNVKAQVVYTGDGDKWKVFEIERL
jgi:hypothetical protein